MLTLKRLILVLWVLVAVYAQQLGDVVEGNVNLGTGNTILSAGNYVSGDGNIVAPMDSKLDIFANNSFFSSNNLFDPFTPTPKILPLNNIGPIPQSNTTSDITTQPASSQGAST